MTFGRELLFCLQKPSIFGKLLVHVWRMCGGLNQGYPSTGIFLYFQILATYFWLYLYVLTVFFRTCKYPSPEYSKYFESTKVLYVCERFLKQIQHILCTPVTLIYITGCLGDGASRPWQLPMKHDDYCCCWRK